MASAEAGFILGYFLVVQTYRPEAGLSSKTPRHIGEKHCFSARLFLSSVMQQINNEPVGLATMSEALHSAQNYHAWHAEWISPFVKGRILDIGSGNANHLRGLEEYELVSVDIDDACIQTLRRRFHDQPNWRFEHIDVSKSGSLKKTDLGLFDTVFSSNVIEHIQDDVSVLKEAVTVLKPGGRMVLVLPALQFLFGKMDKLAGHHRRYDKTMLRLILRDLGLKEIELRYVNSVGALGWWVNGRMLNPKGLSTGAINSQIGLFDKWFVPFLRVLERGRSMPFGQSIVVVAQKPG
jgi:SAM-dependent methyltransferase